MGRFRVATAQSAAAGGDAAIAEIAAALGLESAGRPDFVCLHYGGARAAESIRPAAISAFGEGAVHGGSSCLGVMTEQGLAISSGDALGAFAIWDPRGAYGTALEPFGADPRAAAAKATRAALARAGRSGESPDLVWLTSSPGQEEAVLEGVKEVIGAPALIVGGSAADNAIAGGWSMFDASAASSDAVLVSVLFPSAPFGCAFESGYAPTALHGRITAAKGRTIRRIDDRPAAEVYAAWTDGAVTPPAAGRASILSEATMHPLGLLLGDIDGVPFHILAHPAAASADGGLDLFADVREGQDVWLMTGSEDSLVRRAARIAANARDHLDGAPVAGALMVFCGGCMLAVRERMDEVVSTVREALDGAPFLGLYSFGEQGEMLDGDSRHGNLMISCTVFATPSGNAADR